jgi:hypothetical protein
MRIHAARVLATALTLILAGGALAAADTIANANIGGVFSGDVDKSHTSYGAGVAFLGNTFGFEVEATYTPHFFGDTPAGTNNVTTLMGNLVLSAPLGRTARIYASGGGGLMKFRVPDFDQFFDVDQNDFGVDAGAGVLLRFGQSLGARADVRYYRDVQTSTNPDRVDFGSFHYWRGAVGVTFRF